MQLFEMDGEVNESQKEIISTMMSVVNDSRSLTNDLLEIRQLESGRKERIEEEIKIKAFIKEVLIHSLNKVKRKNIEFKVNVDFDKHEIISNKYPFQRIIEKLVSNAIKYTPQKGKVELSLFKVK
ncbi:MAG: HAMP domain-containing histidine kinase [Reichenbachiella sp.]